MGLAFPASLVGQAKKVTVHSFIFCLTTLPLSEIITDVAKKKNPNAVALGSLGGTARAKKLSKAERSGIAKLAAAARNEKLSAAERQRIAKHAVKVRERKRKERKENEL